MPAMRKKKEGKVEEAVGLKREDDSKKKERTG